MAITAAEALALLELDETERGNIWLTNEEGACNHNVWIRLVGQKWLQIAIRPENYPGLAVNTITVTDAELAAHINKECGGMVVRKANLDGLQVRNGYILEDDGV